MPLEQLLRAAAPELARELHKAVAHQQQPHAERKRVGEREAERDEVGGAQRALDGDDRDDADEAGGGSGAVQDAIFLAGGSGSQVEVVRSGWFGVCIGGEASSLTLPLSD